MAYLHNFPFLFLSFFCSFVDLSSAKEVIVDLNAYYFDASPDGVRKQVLGVNGQFPGPTIRANLHDVLIVRVTNSIRDSDGVTYPTSVHWHGLEMLLSPWYDGPEGVTQCPIPFGESMEYRFRLIQTGTYWYHSHHSWQYVEGFWGLLIVDNVPAEVYSFDDEISISLTDWHHTPAKILSEIYHRNFNLPIPDSGLINGRGEFPCTNTSMTCDPSLQSPALFQVDPDKTYRVRVVNTAARVSFNFSIDGHKLRTIEVDGVDTILVAPVDSVVIWPAQRYSFLVTMNGNLDEYWVRADMSAISESAGQHPKAILKYNRENCVEPSLGSFGVAGVQGRPEGQGVNWTEFLSNAQAGLMAPSNIGSNADSNYVFPATAPSIDLNKGAAADEKHRLALASVRRPTTLPVRNPVFLDPNLCRPIGRGESSAPSGYDEIFVLNATFDTSKGFLEGKINGGVYGPTFPPVLYRMITQTPIHPSSNPQHTPFLERVIQVVINNQNGGPHPWHLHGHTFWVMGTGNAGDGDYNPQIHGHLLNVNGVRRDTTETPGRSWVVLRYKTRNPGAWLLHCHINWHLEVGLGAVFIEGDEVLRGLRIPAEPRRICRLNGL